jgi:hypothetical protein
MSPNQAANQSIRLCHGHGRIVILPCGRRAVALEFVSWRAAAFSLPLKGGGWRPTDPALGRPDDRLRRRVGVPHPHELSVCCVTPTRPALRARKVRCFLRLGKISPATTPAATIMAAFGCTADKIYSSRAFRVLAHLGVRQESWQRIGGESPPRGRSSQPPRPRVMHEVLLARAAVKRSQGRPRAKY